MKRHRIMTGMILIVFSFCAFPSAGESAWWEKGVELFKNLSPGPATQQQGITTDEIGAALKEALRVGSEHVVTQLGRTDGFNADPAIHIPLPEELNTVKKVLSKVGMSSLAEDVELKLNRAAEAATPKAKALFLQAIREMTLDDIQGIYQGPDDAATRYFQGKMSPPLREEMRPIVESSLNQVGAVQAYDNLLGRYKQLPFVPDVKANLTDHVIQKGMDGIFYYLAKEEAAIRKDPVRQTTDLLKKVFGSNR